MHQPLAELLRNNPDFYQFVADLGER